ncbi:hypothetical protein TK35_04060 [Lacticaseibacillus paracasei]|uniref:hypothetical protein n=1 Tax=Lacticaseibacillus paracasei TaxID=1597 RepID=UPI0010625D38|nr:hypothetical protein [Lacticaseibacillus paracasei]TEA91084.1 hypothetical protein TK35_04060 [Lacticaseibacillus paracasei]TEA93441.1 hypothetical protein TK36_04050 [Lacticaseibacillus paracasei]
MLIKLDSGDYVNTDYIERLWMINEHDGFIRLVNVRDVPISENDRDLIVKAMKPKIMLTLGESGKLEPTVYHEGGIDYGAMAFSPLINGKEVTDDEND